MLDTLYPPNFFKYCSIDVPKASLNFILPFDRKNFLTLPAPLRWAAAKIPDSVILIPLILFPTLLLISFLKIHLLTLQSAINAFSCNSGSFKNL
ncbi:MULTISPECIES: hypothetical protein [Tenacibaculum]|uniref:hypothetical protein n=1 Tax=Tenacibaculum TaxID=104267 RepID=UPI00131496BB